MSNEAFPISVLVDVACRSPCNYGLQDSGECFSQDRTNVPIVVRLAWATRVMPHGICDRGLLVAQLICAKGELVSMDTCMQVGHGEVLRAARRSFVTSGPKVHVLTGR